MKQEMINNAMGYNKYLNRKELETYSFNKLLCFVHPLDRQDFIKRINLGESYE